MCVRVLFLSTIRTFIVFSFDSCCDASHIFRAAGRADKPRLFLRVCAEVVRRFKFILFRVPLCDEVGILKTCRCTGRATDISSHKRSRGCRVFMTVLTDPVECLIRIRRNRFGISFAVCLVIPFFKEFRMKLKKELFSCSHTGQL